MSLDTTMIDQDKYKGTATMVYVLYALSFFLGITYIIGVIIAHIKKGSAAGSYVQSHFSYQIRTFWWSVIWVMVGIVSVTSVVALGPISFIGYFVFVLNAIWVIYRIIKGWMRLSEKSAI
jgi:uncharacterized membrane protein